MMRLRSFKTSRLGEQTSRKASVPMIRVGDVLFYQSFASILAEVDLGSYSIEYYPYYGWEVSDGKLNHIDHAKGFAFAQLISYHYRAEVFVTPESESPTSGVLFNYLTPRDYQFAQFLQAENIIRLCKVDNGVSTVLAQTELVPSYAGEAYTCTLVCDWPNISVTVFDTTLSCESSYTYRDGWVGLRSVGMMGGDIPGATFDDLLVTAIIEEEVPEL